MSEETRSKRRCVRKFRAHLFAFRMGGQPRRKNNRCDPAEMPLVSHHRFLLRLPDQLPRKHIHCDFATVAHRGVFASAPRYVPERAHGDYEVASTPLNWFANVASGPPTRVTPAGKNATATPPKCPCAQLLRRCVFCPLERSTAEEEQKQRRPTISTRLVCVPPKRGSTAV